MSVMLPNPLHKPWQITLAGVSFIVLGICEALLVFDVLSEFTGFEISIYSEYHVELESVAVFSLGISLLIVGANFLRLLRENRDFYAISEMATGEFLRLIEEQIKAWKFSDSEREIALLLIKGLTMQEIADVRETKPGTIKSQCNAI